MKEITTAILSWKGYQTIENTLQSYKRNGLLEMTTPFIYFQELGDREREIAASVGIQTMGTPKNVGLTIAFLEMIKATQTPYFMFCECDFELIHSKEETEQILKEALELLDTKGVNVVRLRDRKDPGEPLYSRDWPLTPEHEFKLDVLHVRDDPEAAFPGVFTRLKVGNHDWYTCTGKDQAWSNNVFVAKTEWLRTTIVPLVTPKRPEIASLDSSKNWGTLHQHNHELEHALKRRLDDVVYAQGPGLFRHNRLDR